MKIYRKILNKFDTNQEFLCYNKIMKSVYEIDIFFKDYIAKNSKFSLDRASALKIKLKNIKIASILDLACGTGLFLNEMYKNFDLKYGIGLDLSDNMIKYAQKNYQSQKLNFVKGDMTNFSFEKNFDLITCNYDAINHLNLFEDWKKMFIKVYKHLNVGGYFIFDFNTLLKLKNFNRDSYYEFEDYNCIWHNTNKNNKFNFNFSYYIKQKSGYYKLIKSSQIESTFSHKLIKKALKSSGFKQISFCDKNFKKCNPSKLFRSFVICKK